MGPFLDRLKSRNFLAAFFTALLIICNEGLDLGIDPNAYAWIAGVVTAFILGESYVDGRAAGGGE